MYILNLFFFKLILILIIYKIYIYDVMYDCRTIFSTNELWSIIFSVQWSIQFWAFAIIRIDGFHGNKDLNIENYRNIYGWIIKILKYTMKIWIKNIGGNSTIFLYKCVEKSMQDRMKNFLILNKGQTNHFLMANFFKHHSTPKDLHPCMGRAFLGLKEFPTS